MTHDRAEALLIDLVYGELSGDDAREVERHAAGCSTCAAELARLRTTRRIAATLADEPVPGRGREALRAAARRALAHAPARRAGWTRARTYAVVASAAVVVLVASATLRWTDRDAVRVPTPEDAAGRQLSPGTRPTSRPAASPEADSGPPAQPVKRAPIAVAPPPRRLQPPPRPERAPAARDTNPAVASAEPRAPAAHGAAAPPAAPPRADAPQPTAVRSERLEAPASRSRQAAGAPEVTHPEARSIVDEVERRAAAGRLRTEARRLVCDGATSERVALLDGARVAKLTLSDARGAIVEGWYDATGRLSAFRRAGAELEFSSGGDSDGAATRPDALPVRAPPADALSRCGW